MKYLYNSLIMVALPFALLRLLWRSRKNPDYRKRWGERLTWRFADSQGAIWIHTVSVGEFLATLPLIEGLLADNQSLLVTTTTPTGSAMVQEKLGNRVAHQYLPFDAPFIMRRFVRACRPKVAVFVETEIWPNYLHALKRDNILALLINARLSERSFNGYQKLGAFGRETIAQFTEIACQNPESCERFSTLGGQATMLGNIKFDLQAPKDIHEKQMALREKIGDRAFVVAGSTHKGEEEIILNAYQNNNERRLLLIAPRHPERACEVIECANKLGLNSACYSKTQTIGADTQILIIDVLGALLPIYSLADYAIIGGSFVAHGGHNPLEPALFAKPCVIGEHYFNFEGLINAMKAKKAIEVIVPSQLFSDIPNQSLGQNAQHFLQQNQGATARYLALVLHWENKKGA